MGALARTAAVTLRAIRWLLLAFAAGAVYLAEWLDDAAKPRR